ncbi:MAG: hypothetical protein GF313_12475 [Caldithrix sp.]|nr:hypothetical protein [Caldithrix sp.]
MTLPKKIFVLALDGTPFSLIKQFIEEGIMPELQNLVCNSEFKPMQSVLPPVSSAAWASFFTGQTPAHHGIWGFVDREPSTMDWRLYGSDNIKQLTLLTHLSKHNKRIASINVPMTSPPYKINGIMVGGFLENDITRNTYPAALGKMLKARGYRIDSEIELAKNDLHAFLEDLHTVYQKRINTMWHFWEQSDWDFFMCHIMETDRLHHFFWKYLNSGDHSFNQAFKMFYQKIDHLLGQIYKALDKQTAFMILSDHGFTELKKEVNLNRWLQAQGWLDFDTANAQSFKAMSAGSKAYSLYPGRIYINLQGREKYGSIKSGVEFEQWRQRISHRLYQLKDPETDAPVIKRIYKNHELMESYLIHKGTTNTTAMPQHIPDLLVTGYDGYEIKGYLSKPQIFDKTIFNGMHTFDNAFVLTNGLVLPDGPLKITNLAQLIVEYLNLPPMGHI